MPVRSVFQPAVPGWRLTAVLLAVMTAIGGHLAWDAERKNGALRNELAQMRTRLAEKREVIGRQRQEMTEVAIAVDRLARTTTTLRERTSQARRLAHMEQSQDQSATIFSVPASFDSGMSI